MAARGGCAHRQVPSGQLGSQRGSKAPWKLWNMEGLVVLLWVQWMQRWMGRWTEAWVVWARLKDGWRHMHGVYRGEWWRDRWVVKG